MRYLHEIAVRLLDYNGTPVASISEIPSITREVYDSVCSALGTVYAKAPGLFQRSHEGGLLAATRTGTVDATNTYIESATRFCENSLCTIRLSGSDADHTITDPRVEVSNLEGYITPAYTAVAVGDVATVSYTSYHDAFIVPSSRRVVGEVSINNKPLTRVADRLQARERLGCLSAQYQTGEPCYWWEDIARVPADIMTITPQAQWTATHFICFYPMPEVLTGFTYEALWEPASLADLSTLFSDSVPVSLGLSAQTAREILLPLAVKEYTAKATFSNQRLVPAIDAAFQRATRTLMDMGPKDGKTKTW